MSTLIAYRLALLCTTKHGYLQGGPRLLDRAARVALVSELLLVRKITLDDETPSELSPVGQPSLDAILKFLTDNPSAVILEVLEGAPVTMSDVITAHRTTSTSLWARRTNRLRPEEVVAERMNVQNALAVGHADSLATAVLISLASALNLFRSAPPDQLFHAQCGHVGPFIKDAVAYLAQVADRLSYISTLPQLG